MGATIDDAGDHCLAHGSLERSCLLDVDTEFEEEPLEALRLEGGDHPHVVGPLVAKGVHGPRGMFMYSHGPSELHVSPLITPNRPEIT